MTIDQMLGYLRINGWCVIPDVIPQAQIASIRESVEETTYSHGIRTGTDGVATRKGLLAFNQSFAPLPRGQSHPSVSQRRYSERTYESPSRPPISTFPEMRAGGWHADWPFNQNNAGHIPAPYPDAVIHLTTLWMLSPFTPETGATLIVPGSHRSNNNPTGNNGVDPLKPYPTEMQAIGDGRQRSHIRQPNVARGGGESQQRTESRAGSAIRAVVAELGRAEARFGGTQTYGGRNRDARE